MKSYLNPSEKNIESDIRQTASMANYEEKSKRNLLILRFFFDNIVFFVAPVNSGNISLPLL